MKEFEHQFVERMYAVQLVGAKRPQSREFLLNEILDREQRHRGPSSVRLRLLARASREQANGRSERGTPYPKPRWQPEVRCNRRRPPRRRTAARSGLLHRRPNIRFDQIEYFANRIFSLLGQFDFTSGVLHHLFLLHVHLIAVHAASVGFLAYTSQALAMPAARARTIILNANG